MAFSTSSSLRSYLSLLAATPLVLWSGCIFTTSCVAAGTRVATPSGWVLVEQLRLGDAIFAVDLGAGALVATTITAVRRSRRECLALVRATGQELVVTPDHPVYAPAVGGFVDAGRLALGQTGEVLLVDAPSAEARPRAASLGACRTYAGVHEVFDLTVAGAHPTFVAEGFVVHNKTDPSDSDGTSTSTSTTGATDSSTGGSTGASSGSGGETDSATSAPTTGSTETGSTGATGSTGSTGSSSATDSTTTETGGVEVFPCGDMLFCDVGGEYCQVLHPGIPDVPDSFSCEVMPVECILDPTCACFEKLMLGMACTPTPEGGFVIELFAP